MTDVTWQRSSGENADATVERSQLPVLSGPNKLKLGVFATNLSGGNTPTLAEGPPKVTNWDEILALALAAEEAGCEALIPIGRWKGFGGPSKFWDRSFEAFTWAAGVAQATERIQIFTTCHVGLIHPVTAAKMGATVDHIAGGRWGLNTVAGWIKPEFDMFGLDLIGHEQRYRKAAEWLEIVKLLWTEEEPFDFDGQFYHLKGAICEPRPVQSPYPILMNAGQSPAGLAFAGENTDMVFINLLSKDVHADVELVRSIAADAGREVSVWGIAHFNIKDTDEEAEAFRRYYVDENGDYETAKRYATQMVAADTPAHDKFRRDSDLMRLIMSTGGNRALIGSPERVAEELAGIAAGGVDGVGMMFMNYEEGIQRYTDQLLPLLRKDGLRQ
jgi:FMNH2-dependent dimethyl sulfone monooxygenase